MQTARVTILMTPEKKAAFDTLAAERGISTGEFFRQAGDRAARNEAMDEEELAVLVNELAQAVPEMTRRLQRSATLLRESARDADAMLREAGTRR